MLSQYKRKKNTTKTAVMNAKRKSAPGKTKKRDFKIVKIPDELKSGDDDDSSSDSSSDDSDLDEYEELLLNSIRLPESKQKAETTPEPQPQPPQPPVETQPKQPQQQTPVETQPKQPKNKPKRRSKKVIKKYYINKSQPKEEKEVKTKPQQPQFDQGRRLSYIGMGTFPLQSAGLRSRIINF